MGLSLVVPVLGILVASEEVGINLAQIEGGLKLALLLMFDRADFALWSFDVGGASRVVMDSIQIPHASGRFLDVSVVLSLG